MNSPVSAANAVANAATSKVEAPSASNAITAGAVASSNTNGLSMGTSISSLNELKKKSPELYQKMMQGIGMQICNEMKHHQERLKKLMREACH